jgi:transposase
LNPSRRNAAIVYRSSEVIWRGFGEKVLRRKIAARDRVALMGEIARAKEQLDLADITPVHSCYEAGRDGFWLHRFLESEEVENCVIDSASIEVNR